MHITIYIKNKPLYLCDKLSEKMNRRVNQPGTIYMDQLTSENVKKMLSEMNAPETDRGIFLHTSLKELKEAFITHFEIIEAGGGLILNDKKEVLMIYRRGFWDLPKGKLDEGETIEECAVREVKEETGIRKVNLIHPVITTYHSYKIGKKPILKVTHWFLMSAPKNQTLKAQKEEDITDIKWIPVWNIKSYKKKSFPTIGRVLKKGLKSIKTA